MADTKGFRLWPFVTFSFAVIVTLVAVFAWSLSRKAFAIDQQAAAAHRQYQHADDAITNIRANVYRAALLSHDIPPDQRPLALRDRLASLRSASEAEANRLDSLLKASEHGSVESLKRLLNSFWRSLEISGNELEDFGGTSGNTDKRGELRDAVLNIAEQIDALNEANIQDQETETSDNRQALRRFALRSTALLVALSICVALASIYYLARLERRSETERRRLEEAEGELRHLSQQLVKTQEQERKSLSRELHDEVGQLLTGLRMELGTLSTNTEANVFAERIDSIKRLAEDALRSVRNLALLLRPSMLDDLGLGPALQWQAKEFSRRLKIPVSVDIDGGLVDLQEAHRICLYRVVQEALTNVTRHAQASTVSIKLTHNTHWIEAVIRDDGQGFEQQRRRKGLGLIGMEERVRTLQGTLTIKTMPGAGTELRAILPLEQAASQVPVS
jgi:signal transduction histidine kinase